MYNDGNSSLIGSVPGNNFMFNYNNPDINFINYFVGFDAQSCTAKTFHIVQSNYVQSVTYGVEDHGLSEIRYAPNPVLKMLTLTNISAKSKITVLDMMGKAVLEQQADDVSTDIDFSHLAGGLYIVEIRNNTDAIRIKVLKK